MLMTTGKTDEDRHIYVYVCINLHNKVSLQLEVTFKIGGPEMVIFTDS